jgi:hypothetical protein
MKKLMTTVAMVVVIADVTSANARDRHATGTQMNHERSQKATGNDDGAAQMRTSSGIRHHLADHRSVRRAECTSRAASTTRPSHGRVEMRLWMAATRTRCPVRTALLKMKAAAVEATAQRGGSFEPTPNRRTAGLDAGPGHSKTPPWPPFCN